MEQETAHTLLGHLLLARGAITSDQLAAATAQQRIRGGRLGPILMDMQALTSSDLESVLRAQRRLCGETGRRGPSVLVIDDDPEVGAVIGETLAHAGLRAGVAENAREALAFLTASDSPQPALVILDLCLPGMGGIDLLQALHETGIAMQFPVLVLTGYPDLETEIAARGLHVTRVLGKPVPPLKLLAEVETLLREAKCSV